MIEKKTVIDQIEITRSWSIQIRFAKLLVEDGNEIAREWHRTVIDPGVDPDAQLATVNANLVSMGQKALDGADKLFPVLKSVVAQVHTPEVIKEYRARIDAATDGATPARNRKG